MENPPPDSVQNNAVLCPLMTVSALFLYCIEASFSNYLKGPDKLELLSSSQQVGLLDQFSTDLMQWLCNIPPMYPIQECSFDT